MPAFAETMELAGTELDGTLVARESDRHQAFPIRHAVDEDPGTEGSALIEARRHGKPLHRETGRVAGAKHPVEVPREDFFFDPKPMNAIAIRVESRCVLILENSTPFGNLCLDPLRGASRRARATHSQRQSK